MILVDNCIISSLAKISKLELLKHFGGIHISPGVFDEAMDSGISAIERKVKKAIGIWMHIKVITDRTAIHRIKTDNLKLSYVDCELIYLADKLKCALFTDDRDLGKIAENKFHITIFDLESILLTLKNVGKITIGDIKEIIEELERKDSYKFSKDKIDLLTKE